ncbi:P-loop containing nucleoside triphosphate hydrolase protein [Eremomyces bilateralis CBS 781.70]|uniref:Replication factor C subunit 5 n=1 Tax=Eremomyces bilateralis CBS 781.70 TaxID=1392243 RepID=A0A6G1FT00_9PEZI|nr:P-loop containing nucleoside triphosphate hydrolase protein [Eremomyces bilateralis CBS 781.70]KAF1808801.1 P-loop containing nucleoside triphosphate hydrolase protein [Eremomyces bilateralis CBS 781.70]
MSLLVDKHRPKDLTQLTYHYDLTKRLEALAQSPDFPHLLIYGPSGAGKKTRINCTLRALYGPSVSKIRIDSRQFVTSSNRKLDFTIASSNQHLEITPADVGPHDRVIVQDLLKEVAQTQSVDLSARHRFKVVVVNEAEYLSREAQAALRRTMEKYSGNVRMILVANSTANIIAPIRSRCLLVRVAAPTGEDVVGVLKEVGRKEGWKESGGLNERIAGECGRNLRRALLMFEAVYAQNETVTDTTPIPPPDWEAFIEQIAADIVAERSPQQIMVVRGKLYDLLVHCIPATQVIKSLAFRLIPKVAPELRPEVIKWAAFYEHRVKMGSKQIFHLEAFVTKVMRLIESHMMGIDIDF